MKAKNPSSTKPKGRPAVATVAAVLRKHFRIPELHRLTTTSRSFPVTARFDLQSALLAGIADRCSVKHLSGVQVPYAFQTLSSSGMSLDRDRAAIIAPLEHEDVDIGEAVPVRCLKSTIWMCVKEGRAHHPAHHG